MNFRMGCKDDRLMKTMPVLANVLLSARDDRLSVTGTVDRAVKRRGLRLCTVDRTVRGFRLCLAAGLVASATLATGLVASAAFAATDPPPFPADAEAARQQGKMRIVSMALHLEPAAVEGKGTAVLCQKWKLSEADAVFFFRNATPITSEDHHALYDVMECDYRGKIDLGGVTYEFSINGGSYGEIRTTTSPMAWKMYGCMEKCARLFPFGG
jgi:hypothetical protein